MANSTLGQCANGTPKQQPPVHSGPRVTDEPTMGGGHHVLPNGHRVMAQAQSVWFPLYDRNPQTVGSNIFLTKWADYKQATQRICYADGKASSSGLPVLRRSFPRGDAAGLRFVFFEQRLHLLHFVGVGRVEVF